MRLDKALVHAGWGSRSEMRRAVRDGRVSVDGESVRKPEAQVTPEDERILLDGKDIEWREHYYIVMNKPSGYVSSTDDPRDKTVLELLPERYRRLGLFPVGRLDKDSTGLLLLTTNGALAHSLLSPSSHVPKEYEVSVDGILDKKMQENFQKGVVLYGGEACLPAELQIITKNDAKITLYEGKYHQIKRMMSIFDLNVTRLHRISMGGLNLTESLAPQGFEVLEEGEVFRRLGIQYAQTPSKRFVK